MSGNISSYPAGCTRVTHIRRMISWIAKPIPTERWYGQIPHAAFRVKNNGFSFVIFVIIIIKVLYLFIYFYCMFINYLVNCLFILLCIIFICLFIPFKLLASLLLLLIQFAQIVLSIVTHSEEHPTGLQSCPVVCSPKGVICGTYLFPFWVYRMEIRT